MKNIVVGFSYADYEDRRRKVAQENAISVLSSHPLSVIPIAFGFKNSEKHKILKDFGITQLNILERDSSVTINNNRRLPYIKEILESCNKVVCDVFGYINSDILVSSDVYSLLNMNFDAYIFSRSDIKEINYEDFLNGINIEVIYGGNTHSGADGFFFSRKWWNYNKDKFPDDLIVGETEWDTVYRKVIKKSGSRFLEARVLYHVYHNAKWDINSPGGISNKSILDSL